MRHRSRHQGVGLRPAELGHPVEDVTLDRTVQITMRVKRSVLTYFKAAGKGYQTRINLVPESYVRARRQSQIAPGRQAAYGYGRRNVGEQGL